MAVDRKNQPILTTLSSSVPNCPHNGNTLKIVIGMIFHWLPSQILLHKVGEAYPGFMVMKMVHVGSRLISVPSNMNLLSFCAIAIWMHWICCATTDNTCDGHTNRVSTGTFIGKRTDSNYRLAIYRSIISLPGSRKSENHLCERICWYYALRHYAMLFN
jgi:hypothetical protein